MADLLKMGTTSDEQSKMLHKMKHNLEDWREAILLLNSVLKWEKQIYSGIIGGVVTFVFLLVWWMDMSYLSLTSLALLMVVILDYAYPIGSKFVFSADQWTGVQENRYEEVCQELCAIRQSAIWLWHSMFVSKEQKSAKYYLITVTVLIVLAYVGSVIDNLLLTYLTVMFLAYYPGLQAHGIVQVVQSKVCEFIGTHLKFLKPKPTDGKKAE